MTALKSPNKGDAIGLITNDGQRTALDKVAVVDLTAKLTPAAVPKRLGGPRAPRAHARNGCELRRDTGRSEKEKASDFPKPVRYLLTGITSH